MGRPRLKVLYVSEGYTTHDRRFLQSFVAAGWRPYHLPLKPQRLDERDLPEGVREVMWPGDHDGTPAEHDRELELRMILADLKPDVVIAGPIQSGAYLAARADATPLVAVSWGSDVLVEADATRENGERTRFVFDRSALAFGDCRTVREAIKRHSDLDDSRILTFPWGIDLTRFHPGESSLGIRERLSWTRSRVFISTRTWEPLYAIDVLLAAFHKVLEKDAEARLLLLGDGSLDKEIRGLIESLGISAAVHAPGRVSYELLPDYFRESDVYVSSALSDGTSVSLLEAMASGLPVVVTNSFGNLEWVTPGINGALAEPGDVESLANAMSSMISGGRRAAIGASNVELARAGANWDANFTQLVTRVEEIATK
ncbi:MAG TPA: glycosyltransferase family 4 protein [Gemmatimonadaceae bacterium]